MSSDSWFAWPIWGFIGVVAQVASLMAIALAVYEISRSFRVAKSPVIVRVVSYGDTELELEISNIGATTIVLNLIEFFVLKPSRQTEDLPLLHPGQSLFLAVKGKKLARAWLRFTWQTADDVRLTHVSWCHVVPDTQVAYKWYESVTRSYSWRFRLLDKLRGTRHVYVGPGSVFHVRIRSNWNLAKPNRRLESVYGDLEPKRVWF